jgi:uncharacterized protein (DUF934 family)
MIALIAAGAAETTDSLKVVQIANDVAPETVALEGVDRVELNFPKFTDGRAFSQAFHLRRRLGFRGDIRATGDVGIDQLVLMERTGFSSAVLKEGKDPADAPRQFSRFADGFYQGDLVQKQPHFARG